MTGLNSFCDQWDESLGQSTYHFPFGGVVEPFQELDTCALPTTAVPDKRQSLTRLHRHNQAVKHLGIWTSWIGEVAIEKLYLPSEVVLKMDN